MQTKGDKKNQNNFSALQKERKERIRFLKHEVRNGTYNINGRLIAERMLEKVLYKNVIPWIY